jgi:hypothetical protein
MASEGLAVLNRDTINPERMDPEVRESEQASADGRLQAWLGFAPKNK